MIDIVKDYKTILNNIQGLFIIDKDERIVFMTDKLAKLHGYNYGSETLGKKIKEVMPEGVNNLYKVLYTGKKQIGEMYFFEGDIYVSNGFPIYKDGHLVGAFEYDSFNSAPFLHSFLDKIYDMSNELNFYKKEYDKIGGSKYSINDLIGNSEIIRNLKEKIFNIAKSKSTVLIQGETGCGKELIAHSIHKCGQRGFRNFVKINCATIPDALFESELYGYEEGSFTGAKRGGKIGKAEMADGGTLFLDEIDQLTLTEQPKLLRFLQEKEIARVGSDFDIPVDVRIIAATNQNLEDMVKSGEFREDLYYRLNVMEINVPPLRERKEDIELLITYLLKKINDDLGRKTCCVDKISNEAVQMLCSHDWPGNVRELQNVLERAVNECYDSCLQIENFEDIIINNSDFEVKLAVKGSTSLEEIRNNAEKLAIIKALKYCNGNKSKVCRLLNISRQSLYQKVEKYRIEV